MTASATLYDRGHGLDLADVRAYGPGRLESRPDLKEPVERVAQWQDELIIVNVVGDDDKLRQKQVTLTGTRPYFVDLVKKTSLDAGREIKVFLKPPTPPPAATATAMSGASPVAADGTRATHVAAKPPAADAFAVEPEGPREGRRRWRRCQRRLRTRRQPPGRAAAGVSRRPFPGPQPPDGGPRVARCALHRGRSPAARGHDDRGRGRWSRQSR